MRPTGRLHLGHYVGVLKNWVALQHQYECFYMIADWHALTTKVHDTAGMKDHVLEIALDWLAAGIDPKKSTIFIQSQVPAIVELHMALGMVTPNKWVETDPTLKDMVKMQAEEGHEALTYGLLGYPVLQAADILSVKGDLVPVGKDQLAHLEIVRDIATRFNHITGKTIFPSPKPLLTETPLLPGVDGRKMGKSDNNGIYLADTEDETWKKIKEGITDPARIKKTDPGEPNKCEVIYKYYEVFAPKDAQELAAKECRTAARGCMDCKKILAECINETLRPLRERRQELAQDKKAVIHILLEGSLKAYGEANKTMQEVRDALNLYPAFYASSALAQKVLL